MNTLTAVVLFLVLFITLERAMPFVLTGVLWMSGLVTVLWFLHIIEVIAMPTNWLRLTDAKALHQKLEARRRRVPCEIDPARLEQTLKECIIGQDHVIEAILEPIVQFLRRRVSQRPLSILLAGPPGVGKTEMAKVLAKALNFPFHMVSVGTMQNHGTSSLVGSPKGYAGSDQWGSLTQALLARAAILILFDELEKAGDPTASIYQLLLELLDEGRLTEQSNMQPVDASRAIVMASTNACSEKLAQLAERYQDDPLKLTRKAKDALQAVWSPELLSRFDFILIFHPLGPETIAQLSIKQIFEIAQAEELALEYVDEDLLIGAIEAAEKLGNKGWRDVGRHLSRQVEKALADARDSGAAAVRVLFTEDGMACCEITRYKDGAGE